MIKEYYNDILLIFSSIGVINCFFITIYLLFSAKFKHRISIKLLALLILMLVIRIGKSVVFYFYPGLSDFVINIGLAAFTAVGPLFYLFVRSVVNDNRRLKLIDSLHFIPLLIVLVNAGSFPHRHNPVWLAVYRFVLLQMLAYFLISFERIKAPSKNVNNDIESLFIPDIFKGLLIIWLSYFIHSILHGYPYVLSPLIFTLVFYFLVYKVFICNKRPIGENFVKYKNINLDENLQQQYAGRILKIMEDETIYLKNQLTLSELAKLVPVSPQILSYVINNHFNQNFPDFVNSYRIKTAQRMLNSPEFSNLTISSIAFECGFNSISVFNNAFKKFTGKTPSGFRNNPANS
jgi:AraC-like DNA-binding protein